MGDGLGSFLVVLFFIIVSMMDGAARKRRRAAQELGQPSPRDDLPGDAEDFTNMFESSERTAIEPDRGMAMEPDRGMVEFDREMAVEPDEAIGPTDLWEEIAALARGESPVQRLQDFATRARGSTAAPAGASGSAESYSSPGEYTTSETRSTDLQAGYAHPDQAETHQEHAQVVEPARSISEGRPHEFSLHPAESGKPEMKPGAHRQPRSLLAGVRGGARQSLRDAIVLSEVLSPPIALRDAKGPPYER